MRAQSPRAWRSAAAFRASGERLLGIGGLFWADLDLAVLLVIPRLGPLDPLRTAVTQPPIDSPVFAMVRGGSGAPAVASARVLEQDGHLISSGTPIVRGQVTTPFVQAVGAAAILSLLDQERERLVARAREVSRSTPPLASP